MIKFCKARSPRETLSDLDEYLNDIGDEPVKWLAREVKSWGEFSYAELEAAIADGRLNELIDWQERYAKVVNEHFRPLWLATIAAAAYKESRGRITIRDSDISVRDWLMNHGGRLITQLSEESRKAVMTIILDAQQTHDFDAKKIAHDIRPLIGLTSRQVEANAKYRQKIFDQYVEHGASAKVAAQRAEKAALKYASKQHRYRAETIVHTELAFAYNQGAHVGVLQAINAGFMGRCAMVWTTAGTNRVCPRCLALKGIIVGHTNESGVTLPPIHPRCRCTIEYREIEPPRLTPTQGNANVTPMAPLMGATAAEVVSPTPPKPKTDEAGTEPPQYTVDAEKVTLNLKDFGEAHIPLAKLTKYALNPDKAPDKALAFEKALGYNLNNIDKLIDNLARNINDYEAERKTKTIHGEPFQIAMELTGENNKSALVMTGWIIDAETQEVRLTSIYVKKRKK